MWDGFKCEGWIFYIGCRIILGDSSRFCGVVCIFVFLLKIEGL